jgi:glycerol-3-phosphate dehydrogenase
MIIDATARRDSVLAALDVPLLVCGAVIRPRDDPERDAVARLFANARSNGVTVRQGRDGSLEIPGEAVTDPARYTLALAHAARAHGAELRLGSPVSGIEIRDRGLALRDTDGDEVRCRLVVNCAGLQADSVARLAGDGSFEIYPRKGEFLVFDQIPGQPLQRILLPVPTERTKGVLVFPTIDGKVVAGPTAIDLEDKHDWSVRPEAAGEILPKAAAMYPPLEGAAPIAAYAGLRPAGRRVNYLIGPSPACISLVNVAAIRSTGVTASLAIALRVTEIVASLGVQLGAERALRPGSPPASDRPWWRRTAEYRARVG